MNTIRSPRSTYVAAFILGALIALLLVRPSRGAEPFRLDRVGVVRFTAVGTDQLLRQNGVLDLHGIATWRPGTQIARPTNTQDWALDRPLVLRTAWHAYHALASGALAGFMLEEGAVTIRFGDEEFLAIAPDPDAAVFNGRISNLSTRAVLQNGLDEVIAGFVIEDRSRTVLLRVIGPGLAQFGVFNPAHDPYLTLKQSGEILATNNDWSAQPDAALVSCAGARSGAFPLPVGSRDAALVVVLPPGAYTVHGSPAGPSFVPGAVLVEIYALPEDVIWD
jgi:hypothetical protein